MVILLEADLLAAFSVMEHVLGLLANLAIHFFMTPGGVSLPKGITIFGIDLGFSLATWPLGFDEASFLLGDDGGFMVVDGGGLGRGSKMVHYYTRTFYSCVVTHIAIQFWPRQ